MQEDNNNNIRKMPTSAEIVDVPPSSPSSTSSEISFNPELSTGTTKLSNEELQILFQGRNLA